MPSEANARPASCCKGTGAPGARTVTPGACRDSAADASASCLRSVPAISNPLRDAASAGARDGVAVPDGCRCSVPVADAEGVPAMSIILPLTLSLSLMVIVEPLSPYGPNGLWPMAMVMGPAVRARRTREGNPPRPFVPWTSPGPCRLCASPPAPETSCRRTRFGGE